MKSLSEYEKHIMAMHDRMEDPDPKRHYCPLCGGECETIYKDKDNGEVVGCDCCIEAVSLYG